jgi:HK97 gp10 family phage protein
VLPFLAIHGKVQLERCRIAPPVDHRRWRVAKERVGRGRVEVQPGGLKKAIRKIRVNLDKSKGVALQVRYGKAFYWRFFEYGTPHIRATPFLRPAYEMHKKTALERFKKRYAKYVDDVVKRKAIQEGDD